MQFFSKKINFQSLFIETIMVVIAFVVCGGILYLNLSSTPMGFIFSSTNIQAIAAIITALLLYLTFALQREVSKQQSFENTFFQLLRTHNEIVNAIDLRKDGKREEVIAKGRDCFKTFYNELVSSFLYTRDNPIDGMVALHNYRNVTVFQVLEKYMTVFKNHQSDLGHYFRHLYHIIKYVHESGIQDKKRYTNFVRATLSSYELALLFYNGLVDYGEEKFKPLIEAYFLLKNMDTTLIFNPEHLKEYPKHWKGYWEENWKQEILEKKE